MKQILTAINKVYKRNDRKSSTAAVTVARISLKKYLGKKVLVRIFEFKNKKKK